ncbi:MAG: hypothetical protein AVDCRST_MAG54-3592, partial [uncultured Actinomycetospora sp.]
APHHARLPSDAERERLFAHPDRRGGRGPRGRGRARGRRPRPRRRRRAAGRPAGRAAPRPAGDRARSVRAGHRVQHAVLRRGGRADGRLDGRHRCRTGRGLDGAGPGPGPRGLLPPGRGVRQRRGRPAQLRPPGDHGLRREDAGPVRRTPDVPRPRRRAGGAVL